MKVVCLPLVVEQIEDPPWVSLGGLQQAVVGVVREEDFCSR
jgi:hypothetical protein